MADSNDLRVIVGLNVKESAVEIERDLPQLEKLLASKESGRLKIVGQLNVRETEKLINSQLSELNVDKAAIKITPQLDISGKSGSQGLQQIQHSAEQVTQSIKQAENEYINFSREVAMNKKDLENVKLVKPEDITQLKNDLQGFLSQLNGFKQLKEIRWNPDEVGGIKSFTADVLLANNQVERLNFSLSKTQENATLTFKGGSSGDSAITKAIKEAEKLNAQIEKNKATTKAYITEQTAMAEALQRAWSAPSGNKSVKNADNISVLNAKYNELIDLITKLETAEGNEAIKTKGEIKAKKIEIESMISLYHKMEKAATSLRSKDVDASIIDAQNKVQKFMNEFNGSKVSFTSVQAEMTNLANAFVALGQATDENKVELLHKLLDALGNAQTKFNAENQLVKNFKDLSTEIESAYKSFKKFDDSAALKNNFKNQDVVSFRDTVANLRAEYDKLNAELAQTPKTSDTYKKLRADLDVLSPKLKNAENAYNELQTRLRTSGGEQQAEARLSRLVNKINEYMAVNTKAARKYRDAFQNLLSQAQMKLDNNGIKNLEIQYQKLISQIKIAGDTGKTVLQGLWDNIKKFSGWISMTSIIMRGWRELKQMVTTVRELDTAMTALKRVTNETESSYARFLKNTQTQAVKLHATMTDLVSQITTWSKLGYDLNESQKLAEVSMMYSKVGDVDNETAVKDLVATMKAYNMTAEESIRIVDMLDLLNNKYAVSAKDLGSGLSKVASAMAVSNTSLAKSLSLITGGAEITQDVEGISTALKVINARIRGRSVPPYREIYMLCA